MKKILALLLSVCLMLGMLAGCGGNTGGKTSGNDVASSAAESSAEAAENNDAEAPADAEEPGEPEAPAEPAGSAEDEALPEETGGVTAYAEEIFGTAEAPEAISYPLDTDVSLELMATFPDPLFASYPNGMGDCQIYQVAEEKTGVQMTYTPLSTSASNEQFNVIMASGSYPDLVGWGLNYSAGDDSAVEEDVYLDLIEYIPQYAPNYFNLLTTDDELLKSALTSEGHIVGFHAVRTEESLGKAGLAIRTDMLEKLGLDKPYTIDEFEDVLAAFQGEGMEQPLMMLSPGAIQDNWLAAAFDVAAFCNSFPMSVAPTYVADGEIKFGPLEEGFKEYITLVHDWYEKGYIDSDFITKNSNWNSPDYSNAITTGEAGIFYTDWGNLGGYIEASEIEGFAVEGTYDMHATADSVNHFLATTPKSVGNGFRITSDCSDVELACQWGDWWYSEEGSLLANYGVEGVSFEYVDGVPMFTEVVTKAADMQMRDALLVYASNDTICCVIDGNAVSSGYSDVDKAAPAIWAEGMDDAYVIPSGMSMTAEETTDANSIYTDIETACMESIAKFINGDKSMDEFDAFVEQIKTMNIQGYLDIYQAAYDRYMEG